MLWQKHRPTSLAEFKGNSEVVESLKAMFASPEHPHAFLITANAGTGKTTLARIIGEELLGCTFKVQQENNTADDRGIDYVRGVIEDMKFPPVFGKSRVEIIDEAHKLTSDAIAALLKPVEDCPKYGYYFFCTPEPETLFKTKDGKALKTRLTPIKLKPLSDAEIGDILRTVMSKEGFSIPKAVGEAIVQQAEGNPRDALRLLEQSRFGILPENIEASVTMSSLYQALLKSYGKGRDGWREVASILASLKDGGQDAEAIRRYVMACAQGMLLKGHNFAAFDILDIFASAPTYDAGFPKITACAFKVCHCTPA